MALEDTHKFLLRCRPSPKRLDDVSTGSIKAEELGLNASPPGTWAPGRVLCRCARPSLYRSLGFIRLSMV